jgi:hypothetical protein
MTLAAGRFHLTEDERLLIQAAAAPAGEAAVAWESWCERIELEAITPASFAILPAVAANLEHSGCSYLLASRLRGVRRYAWTQNQVTLRDLATVHDALLKAGIATVAHRGLPIAERYLGDPAPFVCDQVDLLIAPRHLDVATAALSGIGWQPLSPVPPARIRPALSTLAFEAPGRRRVVLHWRCLPAGCPQRVEQGVIDRGLPVIMGTLVIAVPEAPDAILVAAARSRALGETERVRWVLETLMILRAGADPAIVGHRASLAGVPSEALQLVFALDSEESVSLPPMSSLSTTGSPPHGDLAPPGLGRRLLNAMQATRSRYSAACRAAGSTATPWGFLLFAGSFYRHEWQLPPDAGIPAGAIRQLLRRAAGTGAPVPGGS